MPRTVHPKTNGYAHPNSNPESAINDRRRRAKEVRAYCLANHMQFDGKCQARYVPHTRVTRS